MINKLELNFFLSTITYNLFTVIYYRLQDSLLFILNNSWSFANCYFF